MKFRDLHSLHNREDITVEKLLSTQLLLEVIYSSIDRAAKQCLSKANRVNRLPHFVSFFPFYGKIYHRHLITLYSLETEVKTNITACVRGCERALRDLPNIYFPYVTYH